MSPIRARGGGLGSIEILCCRRRRRRQRRRRRNSSGGGTVGLLGREVGVGREVSGYGGRERFPSVGILRLTFLFLISGQGFVRVSEGFTINGYAGRALQNISSFLLTTVWKLRNDCFLTCFQLLNNTTQFFTYFFTYKYFLKL